jgi:hypothetical protein
VGLAENFRLGNDEDKFATSIESEEEPEKWGWGTAVYHQERNVGLRTVFVHIGERW